MFTSFIAGFAPRVGGALALAAGLTVAAPAQAGPIAFGGSYAQDFNALATSGTTNAWAQGSTLEGWYLYTAASADIATYRAGDGATNAGAFYSFGSGTTAERALGGVASGSVSGYIALALTNSSGAAIDTLNIGFNGEQWRNGGNVAAQPMALEYGFGASFGAVAQWQAAPALGWNSPVTGAAAAGVDGNGAGRVPVSGSLGSLAWAPGPTLWLRWIEVNDAGNDHGLAIDDLSITTAAAPAGALFSISALAADRLEGQSGSTPFTFSVTRSGDTAGTATLTYAVSGSGANPANAADFVGGTLPGGSLSFDAGQASQTLTVPVAGDGAPEPDEGFTVTLSNPSSGSLGTATASGTIRSDDANPVFTKISAVQGSGDATPMAGQSVTVQGMLTSCAPDLNGFVLQATRPDEMDGDPATSEGLFVYYGTAAGARPAFIDACPVGTSYQVTGSPAEFNGQTQLTGPAQYTVAHPTAALPAPARIALPVADLSVWERHEGMLVEVVSARAGGQLVVTDNYTLGRYGNLALAADSLQLQFTEHNAPGTAAHLAWLASAKLHQVQLDDRSSRQNPASVPGRGGNPLSAANTLRAGDATDAVVGYLDQFDSGLAPHETSYRVQPTVTPQFSGAARPTAADVPAAIRAAGVKVAAANVLNYFTTLGSASFTTPLGDSHTGRGASNAAEFTRQQAKLVASLIGLDADVYGLMEIQNNGFGAASALQSLTDALNASPAKAAGDSFAFVAGPFQSAGGDVAAAGTDAITVAIIYKRNKLTPVGRAAVPDRADLARYDAFWGAAADNGNRVPIAQTFQLNHADGTPDAAGQKFSVAVNHFKSKGSASVAQGIDQDDGQGNAYLAREKAAAQLAAWLATQPTGDADPDVLLLGDFNAYSQEKTITDLIARGYQKVSSGYSYSFDGLWGSLDHLFASNALVASGQIVGTYQWPINAAEPVVLDYNSDFAKPANAYAPDAYRSSDHDPLLIGLNLGAAPVPQFTLPLAGDAGSLSGQLSNTSCQLVATPTLLSAPAAPPAGWQLPYQLLAFQAQGCGDRGSLTLTLSYPQPLPAGAQLWKWGPTAADPSDHWYTLPALVDGHRISFTLTDGADGDADRAVNGLISDPMTIGVPLAAGPGPGPGPGGSIATVPTLGQWALGLMALLLLGSAAQQRRRR